MSDSEEEDRKIVVAEVESVSDIPGKEKLKEVVLKTPDVIRVVTNAPNVTEERVGQRLVVALEGAEVLGETVKRRIVGGRASEGMLCDARMLGWAGGGAGTAVFLDSEIGDAPPRTRPRPQNITEAPAVALEGLFQKKPTKEEKKEIAKAAREARKAAKK